jgi:spermidine synthase
MEDTNQQRNHSYTLIFAAFISGLCSIIYELLIATTASYFFGDSVKFFSLTIGIYMASMGVGTFFSKYIHHHLLARFVAVELTLALLGGISIPALYLTYAAHQDLFLPCYIFFTVLIGVLIGLEIPFLTRLMDRYCQLNINIANILSFDYFGALIATLAFPFILLPFLGVYQSSLLFGFTNMSIGFAVLWVFTDSIGAAAPALKRATIALTVFLGAMMVLSSQFLQHWDQSLYEDRIVYSEQTVYQRIILTKDRDDVRLYLDGNLQFSSIDEYRYHEALVHIPISISHLPIQHVLLFGAGDGLAIRELLKHPSITSITLVDLDPRMVHLGKTNPHLVALNQHSFESPLVHVIQADAFAYMQQEHPESYDLIIADLPDPNNNALARLYSKQFYQLVKRHLSAGGLFVTQATSPYFSPKAYWSIANTVHAAGFQNLYPYHANVPSFGEWGFVLASDAKLSLATPQLPDKTRFVDKENFANFFRFDKDTLAPNARVNMLDQPILLDYYLKGWEYYR